MTAQAPICHIPPESVAVEPHPVNLPGIPPAQPNIQSLVQTVNTMRQVLLYITGQQGPRGPQGAPGNNAKAQKARWVEASRNTVKVRVFQNNDKSSPNWVDIEQINGLKMTDGITGESWSWSRGGS